MGNQVDPTPGRALRVPKSLRRTPQGNTSFAPVAMGRTMSGRSANIIASDGRIRVHHKEYIADVNGSVAFAATSYRINPGQYNTFPWLSGIATLYESYLFNSLSFGFETQAPTTATGTLIITADYDATDAAPTSKVTAMSYNNYVRSAPWCSVEHHSAIADMRKRKTYYVSNAVTGSVDNDVGNLFVCTQGQAGSTAIGELYVEYDIDLFTPQLNPNNLPISGGNITGGGTVSSANVLGTVPVVDADSVGISVDAASVITFRNPGNYLMVISAGGTSPTLNGPAGWTSLDSISAASQAVRCMFKAVTAGETVMITGGGTITASAARIAIGPASSFA